MIRKLKKRMLESTDTAEIIQLAKELSLLTREKLQKDAFELFSKVASGETTALEINTPEFLSKALLLTDHLQDPVVYQRATDRIKQIIL